MGLKQKTFKVLRKVSVKYYES